MSASYRLYLALYRLYLALYRLYLALCGPIRGGRHRVRPEFEAKSTVRCRLIWPYTASHVFHWASQLARVLAWRTRPGIIVASVGGCALPYSAYLAFLVAFTTIVIERRIYKGNAERVKIDLIWAVRTEPKSTIK